MAKKKKPKGNNKWMKHLAEVRKKYPNKTLGECMKIAKKTYKK